MLQVSNAVVSAYFILLVFRTNCCIWTVWICTTNIAYWLFFFYFCPTQDPDNVIFVMDATIGQACEAQVNMMNQPLVMFYPHSLEFLLAYIAASLKGGLL